jgi:hypothetical protein
MALPIKMKDKPSKMYVVIVKNCEIGNRAELRTSNQAKQPSKTTAAAKPATMDHS